MANFTFQRPDIVLCKRYGICHQSFQPGTILPTLQGDGEETYSFCPDCWVYYQRKWSPGVVFTPAVLKYNDQVRGQRIIEEPVQGQINTAEARMLQDHVHKNIAASQRGTGPAVMAMMPPQAQTFASGSTGYSVNHSQYQALTLQARSNAFSSALRGPSKLGPQVLSIPSLKKVVVGVSLKYRKSGVIALKLVESVLESFQAVSSWNIQTLRESAYLAIHARYLKFARGHAEWVLSATQLQFRQKSGIRIDDKHILGETIQSVFDLGTGVAKTAQKIEVYFEMDTAAFNTLQALVSDESLEEEYDMYKGGTKGSSTHSPLFTDSWDENTRLQMAASVMSEPQESVIVMEVDSQVPLDKGKKRVASEALQSPPQAKAARLVPAEPAVPPPAQAVPAAPPPAQAVPAVPPPAQVVLPPPAQVALPLAQAAPPPVQAVPAEQYDGTRNFKGIQLMEYCEVVDALFYTPKYKLHATAFDLRPPNGWRVDVIYVYSRVCIRRILSDSMAYGANLLRTYSRRSAYLWPTGSDVVNYGAAKEVCHARLQLDNYDHYGGDSADVFSNSVVMKRPYQVAPNGTRQHVAGVTERRMLQEEFIHLTWATGLWNAGTDLIAALAKTQPGAPEAPRVKMQQFGLALVQKKKGKSNAGAAAMLVEAELGNGKDGWMRYIPNHTSKLHLNEDLSPEDIDIIRYLSFTQHVQWVATRGQMFLSDYQGRQGNLSDPQVICDNTAIFGKGNLPNTHFDFPTEHDCEQNPWCQFYNLDPPQFLNQYTNPIEKETVPSSTYDVLPVQLIEGGAAQQNEGSDADGAGSPE